jgi:hypothetical protein
LVDNQHPMMLAGELVDLAFTYQQDGAFFTAAAKLREAADLFEQHARNCQLAEQENT